MMLGKKNNILFGFLYENFDFFMIWNLLILTTLCQILLVWYDCKCLFFLVGYHRRGYKQFRSDGEINGGCFQDHILLTESEKGTSYKLCLVSAGIPPCELIFFWFGLLYDFILTVEQISLYIFLKDDKNIDLPKWLLSHQAINRSKQRSTQKKWLPADFE